MCSESWKRRFPRWLVCLQVSARVTAVPWPFAGPEYQVVATQLSPSVYRWGPLMLKGVAPYIVPKWLAYYHEWLMLAPRPSFRPSRFWRCRLWLWLQMYEWVFSRWLFTYRCTRLVMKWSWPWCSLFVIMNSHSKHRLDSHLAIVCWPLIHISVSRNQHLSEPLEVH